MKKIEELYAKCDELEKEFEDIMDKPHALKELDDVVNRLDEARYDLSKALHEEFKKVAGSMPLRRAFNFALFIEEGK